MTEYALEVIDLDPTGKGWYVWEDSPRWSALSAAEQWVDEVCGTWVEGVWSAGSRMGDWPTHVQGLRVVCRDSQQATWQAVGARG